MHPFFRSLQDLHNSEIDDTHRVNRPAHDADSIPELVQALSEDDVAPSPFVALPDPQENAPSNDDLYDNPTPGPSNAVTPPPQPSRASSNAGQVRNAEGGSPSFDRGHVRNFSNGSSAAMHSFDSALPSSSGTNSTPLAPRTRDVSLISVNENTNEGEDRFGLDSGTDEPSFSSTMPRRDNSRRPSVVRHNSAINIYKRAKEEDSSSSSDGSAEEPNAKVAKST